MLPDPAHRIANRRCIVAMLREGADAAQATAQELREKADRLERSTDAMEKESGNA